MGRSIVSGEPIEVESFYGGVIRGRCIQFTIGTEYAQMEYKDAIDFLERLLKLLKENDVVKCAST